MWYQTNKYFNNNIQQYGCNFFSCLKISELECPFRKTFSKQDIENIYHICVKNEYITQDCIVNKPSKVINEGFRYLTSRPMEVYQVGVIEDETIWWEWVKNNEKYQSYKYMIYKWTTYENGTHFNLYDAHGDKLYDSWPEDVENILVQKLLYYIG